MKKRKKRYTWSWYRMAYPLRLFIGFLIMLATSGYIMIGAWMFYFLVTR